MSCLETSAAAFSEQERNLECSRTDDYLKRKISRGPERLDLIRAPWETAPDPSVLAAGLQLKRARLDGDLNKKFSRRLAPIFKHILPLPTRKETAPKETQLPKVSDESCDDDSSCSLSPGQPTDVESPPALLPLPSLPRGLAGSSAMPPAMLEAKTKKPKVKKLKYHEYVHPDQKKDKELPAHVNQTPGRPFHHQQLLQQLLPLKDEHQRSYHNPPVLPTLPKLQRGCNSSSSHSVTSPSVPRPSLAPMTQLWRRSAALGPRKPGHLLLLDDMRVVELKSELKRRGLTVSGPKNELVERLRSYQELNASYSNTSSLTAGGTTRSGTDGSPPGPPHHILRHQASLNLQPAVAQPLATLLSSGVSPQTICPSTSPCTSNPGDAGVNIMKDMDSQGCADNQPRISLKAELKPLALTSCQFSLRKQKPCLISWPCPTSSSTAAAPGATVDKDKMLQQKDQQIEELTRKLMQKQQLVEMLRRQLQIRMNGGLPQSTGHVKIKQEPPDSCSSPPIPTGTCAIKQEAIKEEELESQTCPGLPKSTQKEHACRFLQQKTENPLQPQERDHQSTMEKGGLMLEDLQNHSKQPTQTHLGQQQRQDAPQQTPKVYQICPHPLEVLPTPTPVNSNKDFLIVLSGGHSAEKTPEKDTADQIAFQHRLQSAAGHHGNDLAELRQKAAERGGDFIEVISQSGEREAFQPADTQDYLTPTSQGSAPPSSPLPMALSPVTSPCPFLTHARSELQAWMGDTDEQQCSGGRLEDSLVGETLLGAEPYGLLSFIDDMHGQMCFPGISERSPSPRDASSTGTEEEHELDLTFWEVRCEDNCTLGPLVPQPPSSVFSTDFLDSFDMQMLSA